MIFNNGEHLRLKTNKNFLTWHKMLFTVVEAFAFQRHECAQKPFKEFVKLFTLNILRANKPCNIA